MDRDRFAHPDGRAFLRRAGCDDAEGRWPICLSPRSVLTTVGISLWLDTFPCDSDGHDCGGRSRIRALYRCAYSVGVREQLHYRTHPVWRVRVVTFDGTARWLGADRISYIHEYARAGDRKACAKCLHHGKDRRADRIDRVGHYRRLEVRCRRGKLQGLLERARKLARRRHRANGCDCIRTLRRNLRGADELFVLGGRMEQYHFYCG